MAERVRRLRLHLVSHSRATLTNEQLDRLWLVVDDVFSEFSWLAIGALTDDVDVIVCGQNHASKINVRSATARLQPRVEGFDVLVLSEPVSDTSVSGILWH